MMRSDKGQIELFYKINRKKKYFYLRLYFRKNISDIIEFFIYIQIQ